MFEVSVTDSFSSAHFLPDYQGKCERLHGHNYKVVLAVRGKELDPKGLLVDFSILKDALKNILDKLDHHLLNELPWFKNLAPSAENIAYVIYNETSAILPDIKIFSIEVRETEKNRAIYYGQGT
ncbi:MAG: 6-carboxytetrahydropterin synthase QueD [Spirochaetaceae bacterium]|nr:MAG: 6-carboxytetrahydropterin synthase QueD [Spirochaetaceae bacterium]